MLNHKINITIRAKAININTMLFIKSCFKGAVTSDWSMDKAIIQPVSGIES